jgi:hypothetical protein
MDIIPNIVLFGVTIMGLSWVTLGVYFSTVDNLAEAPIKSGFLAGLIWLTLTAVWLVVLGLWLK